jgi:hypothetical protein
MALPTLNATFASAADQPRRYMLAQWLAGEKTETATSGGVLVSGAGTETSNGTYTLDGQENGRNKYVSGSNTIVWDGSVWYLYDDSLERSTYVLQEDLDFPWQGTWTVDDADEPPPTVTEIPAVNPIANYVTLPERYLWAKIAVAAGAPRGEADYISLPKNYVWSDIYNAVSGDIAFSATTVSGAGSNEVNGTYTYRGESNGKPYYNLVGEPDNAETSSVSWIVDRWMISNSLQEEYYESLEDTGFPWLVETWIAAGSGESPAPTLTQQTPNHSDWSEKQALGHIAAAYRGDTANPEALATYIDWPWRYQVASIITAL